MLMNLTVMNLMLHLHCQPFSYSDGSLDNEQLTVVFPKE